MMLFLVLVGLALGAVSFTDAREVTLQRGACPMFWFNFNFNGNDRCYKYIATDMTWADAELHCVSEGANLVSIHSLDEQNFVKSLIKNFDLAQGPTWIGLSDTHKEGRWMWSDGSEVNFVFWNTGEPNNYGGQEQCVVTNWGKDLKWNDAVYSDAFPFVCASRTVCP